MEGFLFQPITQDIIQKVQNDSLSLCSPFWINRNLEQTVYVLMTSQFIVLSQKVNLDYSYLFYTPLDFDLKFQVLDQDISKPEKKTNSQISEPHGFKLLRKNSNGTQFHIIEVSLIGVWLKLLGKKLNQVGFQKYFRPLKMLGKGGFATVYEAQRLTDHQLFAVKAFSKDNTINSKDQVRKQNILNEIALMRQVDSEHLIHLEGVFESQTSLYLVVENLTNGHLRNLMTKQKGKLTLKEIKTLMLRLTFGLKELHDKNIMHRDIKPQNIMIREHLNPVIVDFGMAADVTWDDYLFYRCGTPGYISPEVCSLKRGEKISPACDIFSLGVIFHVLLTSRPLFSGRKLKEELENNKKMNFNLKSKEYSSIDPEGMNLLENMLELNPSKRITASEILLHPFLALEVMLDEKKKPSSQMTSSEVESIKV